MKVLSLLAAPWNGTSRSVHRTRTFIAAITPFALMLCIALACRPAQAAVTVTDAANFVVNITANENVTVTVSGGAKVRVVVNGTGTNYTTDAAAVTSLTVTATGSSDNTLDLSNVTNAAYPNLTAVTVNGGGGVDTITGSSIGDTLNGEGGGDTLNGGNGGDTLNGGGGPDTLNGDNGNDSLEGGPNDDILNGNADNDTYVFDTDAALGIDSVNESAASGSDTLDFSASSLGGTVALNNTGATQVVNANLSLILSNQQIENVIGSEGADTITGNNETNVLRGGSGNDTLISRGSFDTLIGNADTDEAQITGTAAAENFTVVASAPNLVVEEFNVPLGIFDVRSTESLVINAQTGADTIQIGDVSGAAGLASITANGGGDDDIFNVTPSSNASIAVNGGAHTTGDTLNFNLTGVTAAYLTQDGLGGGTLTSGNREDVTYTGIEAITPTPETPGTIVNSNLDALNSFNNETTLREAILFANSNAGDDTITFDLAGAGPHTIQLSEVLPTVNSNITFDGPSNESVTIRGSSTTAYDLLTVDVGQTVAVNDLTLSNGISAIVNNGTLTVTGSTLSGNAIGLSTANSATLTNSTISGNTTGIFNEGTAILTNVTVTNNTTGIQNSAVANVQNSIVAGNTTNSSGAMGLTDVGNNRLSGDPELGPLQNNGGPTFTHAPLYGSPAIDAGDDGAAPATDQRGLSRPAGSASDIGAVEVQATYSIVGYIRTSNLSPIAGVTVQLSNNLGPSGSAVTTDANGFYAFSNVPPGGYLVTPTKAGFTFSPSAASIVVSNAPRGANFIGTRTAPVYRIIGRVSTVGGQSLAGITVSLSTAPDGTVSPVTTNSAGYYTFNNVPTGTYTVTPSSGTYMFTPLSRSVTVNSADVTGQNFVATTGYTVYGRIATSSGAAISGVTVTLDGGVSVQTNSAGYYTFNNVSNGSHTIEPTKAGYTFAPPTRTVDVAGANLPNINFTGSPS